MARILLILLTVAAVNALAWGVGFYEAATSMGGRQDWWPGASAALVMGAKISRIVLQPFWWMGGFSPSLFACAGTVLLEAALIEGALRLYGVGRVPQDEPRD